MPPSMPALTCSEADTSLMTCSEADTSMNDIPPHPPHPPLTPPLLRPFLLTRRGLRVRMGLHTGIHSDADVTYNKAAARMQYSGDILVQSKAVSDCAAGGMILLSQVGPAPASGSPAADLATAGVSLSFRGRRAWHPVRQRVWFTCASDG